MARSEGPQRRKLARSGATGAQRPRPERARGGTGGGKPAHQETGGDKPSKKTVAGKGGRGTGSGKPAHVHPDPARVAAILELLAEHDPEPRCALDHANAYELLVATILSAQCTDERVNRTTPAVFARYPGPAALAEADQEELEELIHATGFFRNKAKSLLGMARRLVDEHGGEVPATMDELVALPGVARKTANVVLGVAFGVASGIVVDTHVTRLAQRLGLTEHTDPVKIERDLLAIVPREQWIAFGHRLIRHGRTTCTARAPACPRCPLLPVCPRIGV